MRIDGAVARPPRSTLFVGALGDGWNGAVAARPDLICVDLEDAVPPARKEEGRAALRAMLAAISAGAGERRPAATRLSVRINSVRSRDGVADLLSLLELGPQIDALLLPKVETDDEIRWVASILDEQRSSLDLHAIIETNEGLENCRAIAAAHPRFTTLFFGAFDMSTALGCTMAWEPLLYARSRVVHAAASAGIDVIDAPYPIVADLDGLRAACLQVRQLGMAGKTAKHPSQIATIRDSFTPSADELTRASEILRRFETDPAAPLVFEGQLIELPTIKRLRRMTGTAVP